MNLLLLAFLSVVALVCGACLGVGAFLLTYDWPWTALAIATIGTGVAALAWALLKGKL